MRDPISALRKPAPVTNARWGANLVKHQVLKKIHERRSVGSVSEARLDAVLRDQADGERSVFLHVGLSDIATAFETNPYELLLSKLDPRFESIMAPGFTDYFKMSGVYHKQYSRPKHGTFGTLFLEDADYRTDDAIKSILVKGSYRFEDRVHDDSYHPNGCFAKLVEDDVLVMNIGVPWLTCSHMHYIESRSDVGYVEDRTFDGVLYETETQNRHVSQTCTQYVSKYYSWNKPKIMRTLREQGALDTYDLNGLKLFFFHLGDVDRILRSEVEKDPYFLVTL